MGNRLSLNNFELKNESQSLFITGDQLSINDETILLHLLLLAKKHKGSKFKTSRYRLCKLTGVAYVESPAFLVAEKCFNRKSFCIKITGC